MSVCKSVNISVLFDGMAIFVNLCTHMLYFLPRKLFLLLVYCVVFRIDTCFSTCLYLCTLLVLLVLMVLDSSFI